MDIDWTFKRDSGVYTCRATNRFGTAESTANLVVSSKKDINLDSQLPQGMSLDKLKDLEKVYYLSLNCKDSLPLQDENISSY